MDAGLGQNARITYWLDNTSDPYAPKWIIDIEDDAGCETLSTHDEEKSARLEAMRLAKRRGLDCIFVDDQGNRKSIC